MPHNPGQHYFRGGTYDEERNDPVFQLIGSGTYRDIPFGLGQRYANGEISQEEAISWIRHTPLYNPSLGPLVDTGSGLHTASGHPVAFNFDTGSYELSDTAGQSYTPPGPGDPGAGGTPPTPGGTPTAPPTPPEIGPAGSVPTSGGTMGDPSQSYTVQSGDTVNKIAAQHGVNPSDITGYRSGNPNLIFPGEKLSIGKSRPIVTGGGGSGGVATGGVGLAPSGGGGTPQTLQIPGAPAAPTDPALVSPLGTDPMQKIIDLLTQNGINKSSSFQDEVNQYADYYDQFYSSRNLPSIKTQYSDYQKQFTDLQNKKIEDIAKINEDPWYTEGERVARLQKLDEKYDLKLNTLTNQMTLFKSMYDSGRQDAQFMATQAMTAWHNKQTMNQDNIFKAIDIAEKWREAQLKYNTEKVTHKQKIYDENGNVIGETDISGFAKPGTPTPSPVPSGGGTSGGGTSGGVSATGIPTTQQGWYTGMRKTVTPTPPDISFANNPIPEIGGRTANAVWESALGIAFKDDKVQATVGGLSTNTKTASGRADVAFKRIVTNMAAAIGRKYGDFPYLQALYKADAKAAGNVIDRLGRIDTVANTVQLQFPRLAALADKVGKLGITESDISAGKAIVARKFGSVDAGNFVELLQTIRGDYGAMISALAGGRGGQFFVQNAQDAIPLGLTSAQYLGLKDTITVSAAKATQASQDEVTNLLSKFSPSGGFPSVGSGAQNTRTINGKTYTKGADGLWYTQ